MQKRCSATQSKRSLKKYLAFGGFVALLCPQLALAQAAVDAPTAVETARGLLEQGKVSDACRLLKEATLQMPTWWVVHYDYVRCAKLLNPDWNELREHIQAALTTDPEKASLHYELGIIELETSNFEEAIRAFNAATALAPRFREPKRKIADAYWSMGMYSKAREGIEEQLLETPDDLVIANRLIEVYIHDHLYRQAADLMEKLALRSRFPENTLAKLAKVYEKIGDTAAYRRTMQRLER